jgi:hypothetical protein
MRRRRSTIGAMRLRSTGERDQLLVQLRRNFDAVGVCAPRQRFAALAG